MNSKKVAFCAISLALAFVTSYIKVFSMPYGGTVTLCSMLFIVLASYWFGPVLGIGVGFIYGILQFIQEPYVLNILQLCCDYFVAFAALGVAGFFRHKRHGLVVGYIIGILLRGAFHALGGYLFWMDYMPDNFPKQTAMLYPLVYNYSYILGEGIITIIILSLPSVRRTINKITVIARGEEHSNLSSR